MSDKPKNSPAFPRTYSKNAHRDDERIVEQFWGQEGMTMRQWYKGKIINGFLSSLDGTILGPADQKRLINICGELANAMLKEDEEHDKQ